MRTNGTIRLALALLAAIPAAVAAPPPLEPPAEIVRLPAPAGFGQIVFPVEPAGEPTIVVLVPDALGEDGRSAPYREALLARGMAVLVLGLGDDADGGDLATEPASTPAAVRATLDWLAEDGRFAPGRVGLIGFGAGGRAVLEGGIGRHVAALYPGCRGLDLQELGPALMLHGTEAPDSAACAALSPPAGVLLAAVLGAGHAWDVTVSLWPDVGPLLPDPAGGRRIRAVPDPVVTEAVAEALGAHFEQVLVLEREAAR
jgi:dienelactone hydrolase